MDKNAIFGKLRRALSDTDESNHEEEFESSITPELIDEIMGDAIEEIAQERVHQQEANHLLSEDREQAIQRVKNELTKEYIEGFSEVSKRLQQGMTKCSELLPSYFREKQCQQIMDDVTEALSRIHNGENAEMFDDSLISLYRCGYDLFAEEKLEDAQSVFQFLVFLNAEFSDAWLALGLIEHRLEKYEDAHRSYLMASGLNPENPDGHYWLAMVYLEMNRLEDAKEAFHAFEEAVNTANGKNEWKDRRNDLKQLLTQREKTKSNGGKS